MQYQPYPEYRNSGVEWLGGVPRHWKYFRLRFLLAESFANGLFKKSQFWGEGVKIVNVGDVYTENDMVSQANLDRVDCNDDELEKYQVQNGDFFVVRSSLKLQGIGKSAVILHPEETTVFECHLIRGRPTGFVHPRFLNLLLNSHYSREYFVANANVVTMATIDQNKLKDIELFIPEYEEQQTIAQFLDYKTQQIDQLITKKQTLIDKLNEQRIALITHAVTKGLNPDVAMKDSGSDLLGKVPEHWDVRRIKFALMLQRGHDLSADNREDGDVPVVSSAGISSTHSTAIAKAPGIVTGRYGTIGKFVYVEEDYWPINTTLYSVDTYGNNVRFLWYMMHNFSEIFILNSKKSAVPGVDRNDIHPELTVIPPIAEQTQIVEYLDEKTARIDRMIELNQQTIDKLKEYRTALITAAVTGKIDLRNWQENKEAA